jgi:hypothetical protein
MVHRQGVIKRKSTSPPNKMHTVVDYKTNLSGVVSEVQGPFSILGGVHQEEIVYSVKPVGQRSTSNICMHTRYTFDLGFPSIFQSWIPSTSKNYYVQSHNGHVGNARAGVLAALEGIVGATRLNVLKLSGQGYINDAFAKLKPDLTEISIPNFLIELEDIPKLWARFKDSWSKIAADVRLRTKYGIQPLVGDLKIMLDKLSGVLDRCKEWNDRAGRITQKSLKLDDLAGSGSGTYTTGFAPHSITWSGQRTGTVTAYLTFQQLPIAALEEAEVMIKGYLDLLGFELNPKIIWDVLPFSFVMDWFFDVGSWMQNYWKKDTLELPIVLVDSCLQYKETMTMEHYWLWANDGLCQPRPRSVNGRQVFVTFHRMPIFPDQSAATANGWKMLNQNQVWNGLALGIALAPFNKGKRRSL